MVDSHAADLLYNARCRFEHVHQEQSVTIFTTLEANPAFRTEQSEKSYKSPQMSGDVVRKYGFPVMMGIMLLGVAIVALIVGIVFYARK